MILYHFTQPYRLGLEKEDGTFDRDAAKVFDLLRHWPEGLKAHRIAEGAGYLDMGEPVVWLTADPSPGGSDQGLMMRFKVKIPSADHKLLPLRRRSADFNEFAQVLLRVGIDGSRRMRSWYLYRGNVPLPLIKEIKVVKGSPWWSQP